MNKYSGMHSSNDLEFCASFRLPMPDAHAPTVILRAATFDAVLKGFGRTTIQIVGTAHML